MLKIGTAAQTRNDYDVCQVEKPYSTFKRLLAGLSSFKFELNQATVLTLIIRMVKNNY